MTITYAKFNFNVTGAKKKELVSLISRFTGCEAKYKGAPSFAYEVDYFTIDKNGTLIFDDRADTEEIEQLLEAITAAGFQCEPQEVTDSLTVEMPRSLFTESTLYNLKRIVESKAALIKKALGVDSLPIEVTDEKVSFPWFTQIDGDSAKAYMHLISALCEMARNAKRVTAIEKETENEKYAFRCFLLRLGFIGKEYKEERKILLKNLTGSTAFKNGAKKEYAPGLDPIPTPENTVPFDVEEAKKRLQNPQVQEEIKTILNGGADHEISE